MGFFQNLFTDVKEAAEGAADGSASEDALNERLSSLRTLQNNLSFQWRKQEAEWRRASSVEGNLKRTPLMRAQSLRRARAIASRMSVVGKLTNMVETLVGVIEQALEVREHKAQMEAAMGDPATYKKLNEKMNTLMAQNRQLVNSISSIQTTFDSFLSKTDPGMTEAESAENARLNELYEKLETCQASNDTEGARKVQEEIQTIMSGGSSLTFATIQQ